jgi:hypothetical protein
MRDARIFIPPLRSVTHEKILVKTPAPLNGMALLLKGYDVKQIDLEPQDYRASMPNKKEPILGPRWKEAVMYIIGFTIMVTIVHLLR